MNTKIVSILVVVVVATVGTAAFLLMARGPTLGPVELSYNLKTGESFTFVATGRASYTWGESDVQTETLTMAVVGVVENQFDIRETVVFGDPVEYTAVETYKMSNKGVRSDYRVESVYPPEIAENYEEEMGQLGAFFAPAWLLPDGPVTVGQEWVTPATLPFNQEGIDIGLSGDVTSTLVGQETVTVKAGTFDCWRLNQRWNLTSNLVISGEAITLTLTGSTSSWLDAKTGIQIKTAMPLKLSLKVGTTNESFDADMASELTVYEDAKSPT